MQGSGHGEWALSVAWRQKHGPRTPEGLERSRRARLVHGYYTAGGESRTGSWRVAQCERFNYSCGKQSRSDGFGKTNGGCADVTWPPWRPQAPPSLSSVVSSCSDD